MSEIYFWIIVAISMIPLSIVDFLTILELNENKKKFTLITTIKVLISSLLIVMSYIILKILYDGNLGFILAVTFGFILCVTLIFRKEFRGNCKSPIMSSFGYAILGTIINFGIIYTLSNLLIYILSINLSVDINLFNNNPNARISTNLIICLPIKLLILSLISKYNINLGFIIKFWKE